MQCELVYNKTTGLVTVQNTSGSASFWQEVVKDTSDELIIQVEVEEDPTLEDTMELPE